MTFNSILTCAAALLISFTSYSQVSESQLADTAAVNKLLEEAKTHVNSDAEKALSISAKAGELAQKIGFLKGQALAHKTKGLVYYYQGNYVQTLDNWFKSLDLFRKGNDVEGMANLHGNIGAVFHKQGDEANGLKHHLESLRLAEKINNRLRIYFALNNIGGIYFEKRATWGKALDYMLRAAPIAEEVGDTEALSTILGNIAEIYLEQGDDSNALTFYNKSLKLSSEANAPFAYNGLGKLYLKQNDVDRAYSYHKKALEIAEKLNELQIIPSLQGVASTFSAKKDYSSALEYYQRAEKLAEEQSAYPILKELYPQLATTYASMGNYAKAFSYQRNFDRVKDTLFSEITQKKLNSLQFEFDLEKKQGEINLLSVDKALKETELKRQKVVRNAFAAGLILILFIAFIIFRNYRQKVKVNKILDKQKGEIEDLLLNILPAEVANELQTTGKSTPRSYEKASVLFTDFKGFTTIADRLSPEVLVQELNACFTAFDSIVGKHGLEKIKTIGDAYMCAGGIPVADDDHHYRMIRAALEIQEYVADMNAKRTKAGLERWDIRIGIHVGQVVAGVVGKKKYAYDIWGSTVNVASRMESSGIPGQVNISAATYDLIKDKFACIYRGKIHAKNVGDIDMYLVDHELNMPAKILVEAGVTQQKEKATSVIPG